MQTNEQVIDSNMLSLDHADRGDAAGEQERVVGQAPTPQWEDVYRSHLQDHEGYAYAVARDDRVIAQGEVGLTRSPHEPQNPATTWTPTARLSLASVSKPVTAVAMMRLVQEGTCQLDDPFYPYLQSRIPVVDPSVTTVTLANLLTMKSGMKPCGELCGDIWTFLTQYLTQPLVGTPGQTYAYSNANFTILQALIHQMTHQEYVQHVTDAVLVPMGIDTQVFTATPDPQATATLSYSGSTDASPGYHWLPITAVAPAGWVATAGEILKFLIGVRNYAVLDASTTEWMLQDELGWYNFMGRFGHYYHHNGGLFTGSQPQKVLQTGIIRLTNGYDAVLLTNSGPNMRIIRVMVEAFEVPAP